MTYFSATNLNYDENGNVLSTEFEPKLPLKVTSGLLNQLTAVKCSDDSEVIKSNADLVLASWFNQIEDIELADRDKFQVTSEVVEARCERYENGNIKSVYIYYNFENVGKADSISDISDYVIINENLRNDITEKCQLDLMQLTGTENFGQFLKIWAEVPFGVFKNFHNIK